MSESQIEKEIVADAKKLGWLCWKMVSPGLRGVPDRFFAQQGVVVFMEIKQPGECPTPQQTLRHEELRAAGIAVHWVTSAFQAKTILCAVRFE